MKKFISLLISYSEGKKKKTQRLATLRTFEAFQPQRCDAVELWVFPSQEKRAQTDSHISDNGHSSSLLVRTAKGVRLPAGHICFLGFRLSMNQDGKK